ncbi:MAG: LytTR family transcriptional regulator DNA-binding domain-containing protein, partial [Bacteroidales bacterium]|nr:LytTR family transcriptional regulator DNA-binding domain-containing protein [Bacteroidales bacterium]
GLLRNPLIFGLITFLLSFSSFLILPFILPKYFNPLKWTIGKMSLFYLYFSLLISVVNWYYSSFFLVTERHLNHSFSYYLFSSFIISFSAFVLYIFLNERKKNNHFSLTAKKLFKTKVNTISPSNQSILFKSDIKKAHRTLLIKDLAYIKLQKNKAIFFYSIDGVIQEKTLLISMGKLEEQIKDYGCLIRCHPSYIINNHQVDRIEGNACGYLLQVSGVDLLIPVSRNFPKEFLFTLLN